MEAKAQARFVRVTPQKARRVVDLIRGKQAEQAVAAGEPAVGGWEGGAGGAGGGGPGPAAAARRRAASRTGHESLEAQP